MAAAGCSPNEALRGSFYNSLKLSAAAVALGNGPAECPRRWAGIGADPWQASEGRLSLAIRRSAGSAFVLSQILGFSNVHGDRRDEPSENVPLDDELTQTGSKE